VWIRSLTAFNDKVVAMVSGETGESTEDAVIACHEAHHNQHECRDACIQNPVIMVVLCVATFGG